MAGSPLDKGNAFGLTARMLKPLRSRLRSAGIAILGWMLLGSTLLAESWVVVDREDLSVAFKNQTVSGEISLPRERLYVKFATQPGTEPGPERFTFKLEGHDRAWLEFLGEGIVMRVLIAFFDRNGNWVGQEELSVSGISNGWRGAIHNSPLEPRQNRVMVPERSATFRVLLSSAGAPDVLGSLAVGALKISNPADKTPVFELKFPDPNSPSGGLRGWIRTGNHPDMARVVASNLSPTGFLLVLADEDIASHGDWQGPPVPVTAGKGASLQVDWSTCFSIGSGGDKHRYYDNLQPGRYLFRFRKLTPLGMPTGQEGAISLMINPPFWKQTWFVVCSGIILAGLTFSVARYHSWRRARREIDALRQQNALQAERARIARDLHDTLEQGLTGLSLQIQSIAKAVGTDGSPRAQESIEATRQLVRQCHSELRQSIWNLRSAELEQINLAAALRRMAESLVAGLNIQIELREENSGTSLPATIEDNLLRIAQESVTNAIKNGGASRVALDLSITPKQVSLTIADNGPGFSGEIHALQKEGCFGIQGMQERAQSMGGEITISNGSEGGCVVRAVVPIPKTR